MTHQNTSSVRSQIIGETAVGIGLLGSVLAVGYLTLAGARLPGKFEWAVAVYVLMALVIGLHTLRSVHARLYGRSVEERAAREAARVLPRFGVTVLGFGVPVPGIGDVDIVVGRDQHQMPIEIKSFHAWDGEERCAHTVAQVHSQMARLHATHGVVWLPAARAGWWRSWRGLAAAPDITVAFGSARNVARIARRKL